MVVFFHAERALSLPQYAGSLSLGGVTAAGHVGVDVFFVLSGFIIYHAHRADLGRPAALWRYVARRIARIYPPYWVVAVGLAGVAFALHGVVPSWGQFVRWVLLTPGDADLLLGVSWTLVYELKFYVLFAAAIVDRRLGVAVAVAAVTVAVVAPGAPWVRHWALDGYGVLFLFGIAAAWSLGRPMGRPGVMGAVAAVAFVALAVAETLAAMAPSDLRFRVGYGVTTAVALAALTGVERRRGLRVPGVVSTLVSTLGAASYAIYLVHTPLLGYVARGFAVLGVFGIVPAWLLALAAIGLSILGGVAFHWVIEVPLARTAQGWLMSLGGGQAVPGVLGGPGLPLDGPPRIVPPPRPLGRAFPGRRSRGSRPETGVPPS